MRDETPSVLIIDDDPEFRGSVARLLRTSGLRTQEFSSVSDFLQANPWDGPTCLVLDVRMPGAKRPRASARPCRGEEASADHLHHSARRCADDRPSNEGRCHGVPDKTVP